jgi:hypothetical protein
MTNKINDNWEPLTGIELFLHLMMTQLDCYQALQNKLNSVAFVPLGRNKIAIHLKCLPSYLQALDTLNPVKYRYTPELDAFLACVAANPIPDHGLFELICRCPQPSKCNSSVELELMRGFVSHFLADLHRRLHSIETRNQIAHQERDIIRRFEKMSAYVDNLFKLNDQYTVIRVDLSYSKETGEEQSQEQQDKVRIEFDTIKSDWNRLYTNMRHNQLFNGLEGYIYKIEHGMEKGLHIHWLLFFDTSQCKLEDTLLAQKLGEYWQCDIASHQGQYWNCHGNEQKKMYSDLGILAIGQVDHDNEQKRKNLLNIVRYFCKRRQFIKPRDNPKARLLESGLIEVGLISEQQCI